MQAGRARHAVVDAGRDGDCAGPTSPFESPAAAVGARGFYGPAVAVAAGAGSSHRKLAEHAALGAAHLAAAVARAARVDGGPGFVAGSGTTMTRFYSIDLHILVTTEYGFFKGQVDPLADVLAAARLVGGTSAATEECVENVAEATERVESVKSAFAATIDTGVAEAVITGALLLIAEDLVGLVDLLELVLGAGGLVPVGMEFHRLPAEGPTDLLFIGSPVDAEGLVIVYGHNILAIYRLFRL